MSTEAPVAPAPAPAPVAAPAAPAMPKAIVPPPVASFDHPENKREADRMNRVRAALNPTAEPQKSAETTPAKPTEDTAPKTTEETPSIIKKEAAPVQPAPEVDPVDKMRLPENANPESVTNFANLAKVAKERKAMADKAAQEAADLRKQLEQARAGVTPDTVEIERLRTEHKAAMDRLMVLDLQNHPDFTKQYVEPRKHALAQAKEVLDYNERSAPDLSGLLAKPLKEFNAEISALTKDMNSADATTVVASLRQARELHAREQSALSKSGELHQQMQQRTQQAQKAAFESVVKDVLPNFTERAIADTMSAEEKAEASAYNESVRSLRSNAEKLAFGKLDERAVADLALKGAAMDHMVRHAVPFLERHVASQNQIISSLRAELAALRGGNAPATVSTAPATSGQPDLSKMTVDQRVAYHLKGSGKV